MMENYYRIVDSISDVEGFVVVEVKQYEKDTHGEDGCIRVQTCNAPPEGHNVWLTIAEAEQLRKNLKEAIKFLES